MADPEPSNVIQLRWDHIRDVTANMADPPSEEVLRARFDEISDTVQESLGEDFLAQLEIAIESLND